MELNRQFEKFLGGPAIAPNDRLHVTMDAKGTIFLNRKAHEMMGRPAAVYLYFNRPEDTIVLEPTAVAHSNRAFPLKKIASSSGGRLIHSNPFCRHFGIRLSTTEKFVEPHIDSACRMFLKLSETVTVSRPKARK